MRENGAKTSIRLVTGAAPRLSTARGSRRLLAQLDRLIHPGGDSHGRTRTFVSLTGPPKQGAGVFLTGQEQG